MDKHSIDLNELLEVALKDSESFLKIKKKLRQKKKKGLD